MAEDVQTINPTRIGRESDPVLALRYPQGDILKQPFFNEDEMDQDVGAVVTEPPKVENGRYYYKGPLLELEKGDSLGNKGIKGILVLKATEENKFVGEKDTYSDSGEGFKPGDQIVLVGGSRIPMSLNSFKEYLAESRKLQRASKLDRIL